MAVDECIEYKDLIRKQSVIELIDDLMKSPYANSPQFGAERRDCMDMVKELCVHRLTTAYDVDKVVERLEDKALEHAITGQQYSEDGWVICEEREQYIKQGIDEAIGIVKSGGIE